MRLIHMENELKKVFNGDIKVHKNDEKYYITLDIYNSPITFHDSFPINLEEDRLLSLMIESYSNYVFSKYFSKKACKMLNSLL